MRAPMLASVASVVSIALGVVACSIGETRYETLTLPVRVAKEARTCDAPFVTPDLEELERCGTGSAHCYPAARTSFPAEEFEPCNEQGEMCLPDALLLAGGKKARSCTFLTGEPGACVSTEVKQIKENAGVLEQDVCEPDERCAPCVDPRNGVDTHLCEEQGVRESDCASGPADQGKVEECCHGMGLCLSAEMVPEDSRSDMSREVCSEGKLCAPAAMAEGNPVKCDVLGVDGVCIDLCFAAMLRGTKSVMRGGCGPTEICLPCVIGSGQEMPGCD